MRVIVAGAGGISDAWFGPLKAEGVEVAAVVDLDVSRAQVKIEKHDLKGAIASVELDKVLKEVRADFLLDLTVPEAHCKVTCKALDAGLHVLGEKPMAASMSEARKMVAASKRTGKMYMVSQSRRWEKETQQLRAASAMIGDLTALHCDFFIGIHIGGFREAMASPLILDMAIHHFDLARFFCGQNAVSVYAEEVHPKGSWFAGAAAAHCLFEMGGDLRFTYTGSWVAEGCKTPWNGQWRVIGTKGTVLLTNEGVSGEILTGKTGFYNETAPLAVSEMILEKPTMRGALGEMLAYIQGGAKPQTACADNIESLAMVFGAMESARRGRRVRMGGGEERG